MPKPTSAAESGQASPRMKVVMLTLDTHLSSSVQRSADKLTKPLRGLELRMHAASEYRASDAALKKCLIDIERADLLIVTMLFMEDHYLPVLEALKARRDHCDAMVCIMSAPPVMQLTRMGKLSMGGQSTGLMAILKKLRPKAKTNSEEKSASSSEGAKQMAMLRRLPKLLRFIPGTAQDLRIFFLTMRYWLAGSEQNISSMVVMLVNKYAQGDRKQYRDVLAPEDAIEYPEVGLYHPKIKGRITESLTALPGDSEKKPAVGLLLLRSYLLAGNALHYDAVIEALEARGLRVIPAFASGLDARPAIENYYLKDGRSQIDALVSLTGFSLVGGPAYNDAKAAEAVLAQLNVPYIAAHPVEFQPLDQWGNSQRGLLPVETTIMVAIPELDGSTIPMVYGGRPGAPGTECRGCDRNCHFTEDHKSQDMFTCEERTDMLALRVEKQIQLRLKARQDRKIALVIFNFPPNSGNVGTAAYLSVFESLFNTLKTLANEGYQIEVPRDVASLRDQVLVGNKAVYGADANVHQLISTRQYIQEEPWLKQIESQWGPAPGRQLSNGQGLFIQGAQFGQALVCIQPGMGYEGDPMRLLFEGGFAPTHAFSAFYRYLRQEFAADAVLHFGTHGALEFMPGKQSGLSGNCWPDRMIQDLPNFYFYASNNPSEGAIAKRRGSATLISYLPPTFADSGLYKELMDLRQTLDRWRALDDEVSEERNDVAAMIHQLSVSLEMKVPDDIPPEAQVVEPWINGLIEQLLEIEYTLIPEGLHVIGQLPTRSQRLTTLKAMALAMEIDEPALLEKLVDGVSESSLNQSAKHLSEKQRLALHQLVQSNVLLNQESELNGLLKALDGGYALPAPGGDLLHNPDVLPTGRNLHGLDPFKMPTAFAVRDGQKQAAKLLARYAADGAGLPESIAMVLWGSDNLKTEGGPLSQALALMGVSPRFDTYGRLAGAQLVPLAALQRPRIDVVITLSGIFRDLLPMQIKLLAEASFLAASAEEPLEMNFIRKHALAYMHEHGVDLEAASLRVFGNTEGAYGANVNLLVDSSTWQAESELGEAFTSRKGFAFGLDGKPVRNNKLLQSVLADVSLTYQNLDSVELGVTSIDTYFDTLGGISRAVLQAKHERHGENATVPPVYIVDQTQGDGVVRSLTEQVALETRTRMLNPKWHEGMLQHGYEGVRQIEVHLTNTMGWSATTGQVQPWVYQQLAQTFVLDPAMRERMAQLNPTSSAKLVNRLIEASRRDYWKPDEATQNALLRAGEELEDRLEGITEGQPA